MNTSRQGGPQVIVTGFGPFGEVDHNPSGAVLDRLPRRLGEARISTLLLPVDTEAVRDAVERIARSRPTLVLHTGVAVERSLVTIETRARNRRAFTIPDVRGNMVEDAAVREGAPEEIASRLPLREILDAWRSAGIPAERSEDAGLYLCNQIMFESLACLPAEVGTGFIHLPPDEILGERLKKPHLPLAISARAVLLAVEAALLAAGSSHPSGPCARVLSPGPPDDC